MKKILLFILSLSLTFSGPCLTLGIFFIEDNGDFLKIGSTAYIFQIDHFYAIAEEINVSVGTKFKL